MIFRNVLSNWFGLLVLGLLSFILTPILIHGLGDFYYGLWVLVTSLVNYYGLLDMGLRVTIQRYVARFRGAGERNELNRTFSTALSATFAVSALAIFAAGALSYAAPYFFRVESSAISLFQVLVLLLGANLALVLPLRLLATYLCGFQRFDLYNLGLIASEVLRFCLTIAALRLGYGVVGVAVGTLAVTLIFLPLHWWLVRRVDPALDARWHYASWKRLRELASFSFYVFLNMTGERLRAYTDALVIARILGVIFVTPFNVVTRLMEYFKSTMTGISGPIMPAFSQLDSEGREAEVKELFLKATRMTTLLSMFITSMFLINGRNLLHFWVGPQFTSSYTFLALLTIGYLVGMAQSPSTVLILARGKHRPMGLWNIAEGLANLGLSIYWTRKYGLIGVAAGTLVPMLFTKICVQPWYTLRVARLSALEYLRAAFARPALVALLFVGCSLLLAWTFPPANLATFLADIVAETLIFGLLFYRLGLLAHERAAVRQRWMRLANLGFGRFRTPRRRRYLLGGYYGMRNVGDDVLLYVTLAEVAAVDPSAEFTVISSVGETVPPGVRVNFVPGGRRWQTVHQLLQHDIWLFGGGGLLQDGSPKSRQYLRRLQRATAVAKFLRRKVAMISIGVGPLDSPNGRAASRELLQDADLVTVRDPGSASLAQELVPKGKFHLTADLAFLLPRHLQAPERNPFERKILGVSLLPFSGALLKDSQIDQRAAAAVTEALNNWMASHPGWDVKLFEFFAGSDEYPDRVVLKSLHERISFPERVSFRRYDGDFSAVYGDLSRCSAFFGMRYHSSLLSWIAGVPCLMAAYHLKCIGTARYLKVPAEAVMPLEQIFDSAEVKRRLDRLVSKPELFHPGIPMEEVTLRARRNFELFSDWLEGEKALNEILPKPIPDVAETTPLEVRL